MQILATLLLKRNCKQEATPSRPAKQADVKREIPALPLLYPFYLQSFAPRKIS